MGPNEVLEVEDLRRAYDELLDWIDVLVPEGEGRDRAVELLGESLDCAESAMAGDGGWRVP